MHEGEVVVDAGLVRRLVAAQFPQWAGQSVARVPSAGTDNAMFRLGDEMLVRLPRIDWAVDDVGREQLWLPRLAPHLPFRVPTPLALGEPGEGYPWTWSVYDWLDGVNPTVGEPDDPLGLAVQLAQFTGALQRVDTGGAPRASRGEPLQERDEQTRAAVAELSGAVDTVAVLSAWDRALEAAAWAGEPVWVHGDLSPGNLLLVGGRLSAVIDFGGVGVGDPACDLIVGWNLLPPDARFAFREATGADDDTWARGRGWALSVALIQLPYYAETNVSLAGNARYVVAQVLAEH
jgi:aminoglycoside phosphotransferase (APT) family kinase protein